MATTADPASLDQLAHRMDRIEAKLDALTASLEALTTFSGRAHLLAEVAGDGASFAWEQAEAHGIDPLEAGQAGLDLALALGRPDTLALVARLAERTDALEAAVEALDGVKADDLARAMAQTAALLGHDDFQRLLAAAPEALSVAGPATTALTETRAAGWDPKGPLGALMAITDPDVQKAVGFALAVAKRLGAAL